MIRVLIADDHAMVRQGLRTLLELQDGVEVVGEAADGEEAVAAIASLEPDVALMDLVMPRLDGIEAMRRVRASHPGTRVIALTSFADDDTVFPAVRAGAAGYLLKDVQPQELVAAIRTVDAGGSVLAPSVAARLMEEVAADDGQRATDGILTARELDVLRLVAEGMANKVIAQRLGIAEKTVKTHVSNILGKLGLSDRTQAAVYAVRAGLVQRT